MSSKLQFWRKNRSLGQPHLPKIMILKYCLGYSCDFTFIQVWDLCFLFQTSKLYTKYGMQKCEVYIYITNMCFPIWDDDQYPILNGKICWMTWVPKIDQEHSQQPRVLGMLKP
jgi:hypothetical protein